MYDVVVTGTPSERWGEQVTAVVALRPDATPARTSCATRPPQALARYKLPKAFVFVDEVVRSPSGKPDYRWAKEMAVKGR